MSGTGWFYLKGDQRMGPFTAAQIDALLLAGTLTPDSEVWHDGMREPKRIADLPDRMAALLEERQRQGLIAPKQRYYARQIDTMIGMVILGGPVLVVLNINQEGGPSFWILPAILLAFLGLGALEALTLALWGTTPGKWIFGLEVRDRQGRRPTLSGSFKRQIGLAVYGYGLGLPFIAPFTMFMARRAANRGEVSAWDRSLGYEVRRRPVSRWRFIGLVLVPGAAILAAQLVFTLPALVSGDFGLGFPWKNPTTQINATLPFGWRYSATPDQAASGYHVFVEKDGGYVILAHAQSAAPDLAAYAQQVKADPDLGAFWGETPKTDERGRPYIELSFTRQVDAITYGSAVRLWQIGPADYWRLILAWRADQPSTRSEQAAIALQKTLP